MFAYAASLAVLGLLFWHLPTSFLPEEDQGMLMVQIKLPSGATQQQTLKVIDAVSNFVREQPEVESMMAVAGFSTGGSGQNSGMGFVRLKDWSVRDADAASRSEEHTSELQSLMRISYAVFCFK